MEEADRMLVYLIKRVAIFVYLSGKGKFMGEMKNCSWKFVCITFLGIEEKESLLKQS